MAQHETIMGDEMNHKSFKNPNIKISHNNNDCNKTDNLSNGITLMGLSSDSQPLKFNENNNKIPLRNGAITLMGSCTDLKFRNNCNDYKNEKYNDCSDIYHENDEMKFNQSITLMGQCTNTNQHKPKRFKKRKKISSESYWKMFVFQQPQIFTQIISYLLPFQKIRL
eukprot:34836_1